MRPGRTVQARAARLPGTRWWLVGADDLEVLVDEDVMRPVDADVVDLVLAVAQLYHAVDDASGVGASAASVALLAAVPLTIVPDPWL